MRDSRSTYLIHLFAIAHAVIVLMCYALDVSDELLLTLATVAMIALIGVRKGQNISIIAISVIAGNILGYLFGTYGAKVVALVVREPAIIHAITTFCFTEIIGYGLVLFYGALNRGKEPTIKGRWTPHTFQLLVIIVVILLARIAFSYTFGELLQGDSVNQAVKLFLGNTFAVIITICINIIYVILLDKYAELYRAWLYICATLLQSVVVAVIVAVIIGYDFPFMDAEPFATISFVQLCAVAFIANIVVYIITMLIYQLQKTRRRIKRELEKRHLAQFRYNLLKQQMNPHFLFNSLNILNGLIEEQQNEQAEEYVRKLAMLYRYMLKNEDDTLVTLREEMDFTDQYIDLLKVRFRDGFKVRYELGQEFRNRHVVPCGIQLLIENALKHNIAHPDNPLLIDISFDDSYVSVRNNRQPKLTTDDSTKMGLKNLSQQYKNIIGDDIVVDQSEEFYEVCLPLI